MERLVVRIGKSDLLLVSKENEIAKGDEEAAEQEYRDWIFYEIDVLSES